MPFPSDRRTFLKTGAAVLGALAVPPHLVGALASRRGRAAADVSIDVLTAEPIAPVTSAHYGHFIEHLGAVIYDGVWVGEKSSVPNVGGIRKSLVDDLRALTPGIVRWPGGCFADSYRWTDGIGPKAKRPRRSNLWGNEMEGSVTGPQRYEPNHFGTPEFLRFCRLVGAEPYLAVNGRGASAQDFAEWVEYCNSPKGSTTLADQRAADGSPAPYNVKYWGLGNEPWGCGGTLTPEEYAEEYRRMSAFVPTYPGDKPSIKVGVEPRLVAAGPLIDDATAEAWTRRFIDSLKTAGRNGHDTTMPFGYSLHSYFWRHDAFTFTPNGWYTLLAQPRILGGMLERQASLLRPAGVPITLVLDEWGPWYLGDIGQSQPSHLLEQTPTLRDALVTAFMFDTFHAHADILGVATVAQTINCIHSLFLADGAKYVRTPVYHAFALYQPHIGGTAVRTVAAAERIEIPKDPNARPTRVPDPTSVDGISTSATVHAAAGGQPGRVVLTVTNPRLDSPVTANIALHGVSIKSGTVTTLTHNEPHARNTFDNPDVVHTGGTTALALGSESSKGAFTMTLPAASVTRVVCTLGA